jgi:hypothetical protein
LAKCTAITRGGERCKGIAIHGSDYCHAHDPERADIRKRAASRGGRRGGRGRPTTELARLQKRFEELAEGVLEGEIEQRVGATAGQLLNYARACVRDTLTAREHEEFAERLEAIEAALEQHRDRTYGA